MTVYLDCAASSPLDPRIRAAMFEWMELAGNPHATHHHGRAALGIVDHAREKAAKALDVDPGEIFFTGGATESNNLALSGLIHHGRETGRYHIVTTTIEHSSVLSALENLERKGFRITRVHVDESGRVNPLDILDAVQSDTLLVSMMFANNVTGILQPVRDVGMGLANCPTLFHVDAAQGLAYACPEDFTDVDLLSLSGHKIYGPQGIGVLIIREQSPLDPLMFGGGQQMSMRPGTIPFVLAGAMGMAVELMMEEQAEHRARCRMFGRNMRSALESLDPVFLGDELYRMRHIGCLAFPGIDAALALEALAPIISISRGSASATDFPGPSHVLEAMGLNPELCDSALRISWSRQTPEPDWQQVIDILKGLRQ